MSSFVVQLGIAATALEGYLEGLISRETERGTPHRLVAAMAHGLLGGGKRFRPYLVLKSAELFGIPAERAYAAAAAVECVHCYSLIHDDLPSMDNDETRRGQPTVWKAFGDWAAILAGDALQALAFELLTAEGTHGDASVRAALVHTLALAAGAPGMVGGQILDLEAACSPVGATSSEAHVLSLQTMKTGKLITAACEMGAILGKAHKADREALVSFGRHLGLAFQISDDLLDAEGHATTVGKATGKDAAQGKATLVSLLGLNEARRRLDHSVTAAVVALAPFGSAGQDLAEAARYLERRES